MRRDCDVTVPLGVAERGLEPLLLMVDERIAITSAEYAEARARLEMLKTALTEGFRERIYFNGSIEHGDALTPLNDIDIGVIFNGPLADLERRRSPTGLMGRACEVIKTFANDRYPGISADFTGQKRSVVVQFGTEGYGKRRGFTADVIVALDYLDGRGVLVPNLLRGGWDRSDPIMHSEMMHCANSLTNLTLNKVVRIVKQWNRRSGQPLSSWNIKALALSCLTKPTSLTEGLHTFFHYAAQALTSGLTPDPAGVASPIGLELPRHQVLARLRKACDTFDNAIVSAGSGRLIETRDLLVNFLAVSLLEADGQPVVNQRPFRRIGFAVSR